MNSNIVLMGPIKVGKTSVAKEIAKRLDREFIDLDDQRERFYDETSYSGEKAEAQFMKHGIMGWYRYQKPYELYSVKRILEENQNAVIAFGGGQSVYEDKKRMGEFIRLMEPVTNSFLLMPYQDTKASLELLSKRTKAEEELKMNELFVCAKSSRLAAKHILYVEKNTINQISDKVIALAK